MDCKVGAESLIDFHFGKINPAERSQVEYHLSTCPTCLQDYFNFKRDFEVSTTHEKPSELVRFRIKKDFATYCESLLSEEKRAWLSSNRVRLAVGLSIAAAGLFMILYSGQMRIQHPDGPSPGSETPSHELRSLDEAVDSGRSSPGHINMI